MLKRIEQFLFYFLLFAIPFQTRKILWYSGWHFNEWSSVYIYATDVLLAVLFIFWFFSWNWKEIKSRLRFYDWFLVGLIIASAISIKNATLPVIGLFQLLKLIEFIAFYFYLKTYAVQKFQFRKVCWALMAGGAFQAITAILQFFKQSDLGLRYFGESVLGVSMGGVAVFINSLGNKVLRAYGTTPHPNILAAYLFIAAFGYYFGYLYSGLYHQQKPFSRPTDVLLSITYAIILFGFFFTFSRTIIFLWLLGFGVRTVIILTTPRFRNLLLVVKDNRIKLAKILLVGLGVITVFIVFYWPDIAARSHIAGDDEAVSLRVFYAKESLKTGINLFGVGIGNFVDWFMNETPHLSQNVYQPVHNIYLLIYSETGILGIAAFGGFLMLLIRDYITRTHLNRFYHYTILIAVLTILTNGLFDHFLWTLQEGRFILWFSLTLLAIGDII